MRAEGTQSPLDAFFAPRSIAVVGASATPGKAGHFLLKNILDGGYEGEVYPINPGATEILGRPSFPSVEETPEPPELAFLVVSNELVVPVLHACVRRKVRAVMIVTAGFGELGEEGVASQQEVARIVKEGGVRAAGPNSVGLVSAGHHLMGSFVPFRRWPDGPVAIAAQTGIFSGAYMDEMAERETQQLGFSRSICLGNTVDVDEADFVEYAAADPATRVIALHLESFRRPRAFLAVASEARRHKPVVLLKTGRTEAGALAAASHSGALASEDRVVRAALRQYGIVRVETLEEFMGTLKAFAWQPVPRGPRVGIVTLSGALGVMAVDEMSGTALELAQFAPETRLAIGRLMPEWQTVGNPADMWMALGSGRREAHEQVLGSVLDDPGVDMMLCILLAIPNADFPEVHDVFERLTRSHPDKPVFLIVMGGQVRERWLTELDPLQLPAYADPRSAVRAMEAMWFHAENRDRISPDPLLVRST